MPEMGLVLLNLRSTQQGAGEKRDYQIRYTAKGTMDGGAIRLAIAEDWSVSDGEEKVVVTSSGDIDSDNIIQAFTTIDGGTPNVTVSIKTLGPGQMIVITLKEARAQPNKPTPASADADEIPFRFEASRVPFDEFDAEIISEKELKEDAAAQNKTQTSRRRFRNNGGDGGA